MGISGTSLSNCLQHDFSENRMIALFANKQRRRRRKCRSPPRNTTGQHSLLIPGCADITHARSVDTLLAHPLPKAGEVGPSGAASVSSHRTKIAHLHGQESSLHPHSGVWAGFFFFFFNQSLLKFIYWLCWVFAAGPGLSPAAVSRGF